MNKLEQILNWLDGKKAVILSISALILSYLVTAGILEPSLGTLLQSILSILGGGAVYATSDLKGANRLGIKKNP